jgi:hypothetical protein
MTQALHAHMNNKRKKKKTRFGLEKKKRLRSPVPPIYLQMTKISFFFVAK